MGLDDLRRQALEEDLAAEGYENYVAARPASGKMFGMTAAERMFVSIGCFLFTSLAGFFLLLILDKIEL